MATRPMKLGYNTGYWSAGPPPGALEGIMEAERLGFDSVWTAEAYGSDALDTAGVVGSAHRTDPARHRHRAAVGPHPAATAMAAMTLDHLSGGRVHPWPRRLGPAGRRGVVRPALPRPLARTREYVDIVRRILARGEPVELHGEFYDLPLAGGAGLGKPLKSTVHPLRSDMPIYLAAEGPKNVALAAEIGDGWLPLFFAPKEDAFYRECLAEGFAAAGDRPRPSASRSRPT